MSLPTQPQSRAGMPPRRARVLLGASAKVGKSTLLGTWAPKTTLIVDTQNGTLLLDGEHYVQHVSNWPQFISVVDDITRGGHMFHTIGLDLVNDLWRMCDMHYGKPAQGIPASGIDDYGKSSAKAQAAFTGQIGRLLAAPVGIWFLTHLIPKTDKTGELTVYKPDLNKNVNGYIEGAVDFLWLAEVAKGKRVIHTQPTPHFEAGSRVPMPSPLPMDARAIATAMDRALNPQNYDEKGERLKADPEPSVVEPSSQKPLEARREDVKRTGASDIPATPPAPACKTCGGSGEWVEQGPLRFPESGPERHPCPDCSATAPDLPWDNDVAPGDTNDAGVPMRDDDSAGQMESLLGAQNARATA